MSEIKLDPDFKAKWAAALRSGQYEQGKANLFNPDEGTFCCLGVAGDLNAIPREKMAFESNPRLAAVYEAVCPGLKYEGREMGAMGALIYMNDNGKSFSEIADYIEANL